MIEVGSMWMSNAALTWIASIAMAGLLLGGPSGAAGNDTTQATQAAQNVQAQASHAEGTRAAQSAQAAQAAVWTPKELRFVYQGFTSRYSCDGLRDKIRDTLLRLGARKEDLKVIESPCAAATGRPTPFPGVLIRMNVLVPAAPQSETAVPAHWQTVELGDRDGIDASGECELIEQIKQKILPLFAARNVELTGANCVPHQVQPVGPRLKADVLIADRQDVDAGRKP